MAIMYLYKGNFTCLIVQISLYLSVLNNLQFQKHHKTMQISTLVNSVDPDQLASEEAS